MSDNARLRRKVNRLLKKLGALRSESERMRPVFETAIKYRNTMAGSGDGVLHDDLVRVIDRQKDTVESLAREETQRRTQAGTAAVGDWNTQCQYRTAPQPSPRDAAVARAERAEAVRDEARQITRDMVCATGNSLATLARSIASADRAERGRQGGKS